MKIKTLEIAHRKLRVTAEFQPVLHLSGKTIFRYEVLAKIINAEDDSLLTEHAIDIIEQPGAINAITDFLFDTVCELLKMKEGITISFNLPPQLMNDDYLAGLYQQCVRHGVQPQRIEIEISERLTRAQLISSQAFLQQARAYGFMLSLDDFGAGNLPADGLQLFHFDTIKIDRSLIAGIAASPAKQSTLHNLIDKVIPAGTHVICEGVERSSDLALLSRYNHIGIEGYMFSRSLTFNQLKLLEGF